MISVCILTKNAGPEFARYLHAWREQRVEEEVELLLVDSGSDDATVETGRALPATSRGPARSPARSIVGPRPA